MALLPLDSRPVCSQWPTMLAKIAGITLQHPLTKHLNHLKQPANIDAITQWIETLSPHTHLIIALDTLAHGGLIPSRQGNTPLHTCQHRVETALKSLHKKNCTVAGFSSIMRTPNYNNAEEEPDYWAEYGRDLHAYSAAIHRDGHASDELVQRIPEAVRQHFLTTRERNHTLNQQYLHYLTHQTLQSLTYCLDDSGPYGVNQLEAHQLTQQIMQQRQTSNTPLKAHVQTGADEVACTLLSHYVCEQSGTSPRIYIEYSDPHAIDVTLKFDGISVTQLTEQHIERCGGTLTPDKQTADMWLLVHTPPSKHPEQQGDWCERVPPQTTRLQHEHARELADKAHQSHRPLIIADIASANGSDPALVLPLLQLDHLEDTLYGYAGWNTPGNTMGSALSMGIIRWVSEQQGCFDSEYFKYLLLVRLTDDWLYQSNVRQHLSNVITSDSERHIQLLMDNGLNLLRSVLAIPAETMPTLYFPCHRRFEIGLQFTDKLTHKLTDNY